jgi:WD40 repeat protein
MQSYFIQQPDEHFEVFRRPDHRPAGALAVGAGTPVPGDWAIENKLGNPRVAGFWRDSSTVWFTIWQWEQRQALVQVSSMGSNASFSRDGTRAAAVLSTGEIGVFDALSGRELHRVPTQRELGDQSGAYLHPFRPWLASANNRNECVEVWNFQSGERLASLEIHGWCRACEWSNDGRFLFAGEDQYISVWDMQRKRRINTLRGHQHRVVGLKYHPHEDLLFSSSWDRMTRMWDPYSGRLHVKVPGHLLRLSPDGQRAAFRDRLDLGLWEIADGRECRTLHATDETAAGAYWSHVVFSNRDQWLAVGSNAGVVVWDLETGHEVQSLPIGGTFGLLLDPAGENLITSGYCGVLVWPIRSDATGVTIGPPRRVLEPAAGLVAFLADGERLVVKRISESVYCEVDYQTGEIKHSLTKRWAADHAVSADGRWLALGNKYGKEVTIWDCASWQQVASLPSNGDARPWFSPCNRWLLIGDADSYDFYAQGTWDVVHAIPRNADAGQRVRAAFNPTGAQVAVIREGYKVQLLETATWQQRVILEPGDNNWVHGLAFSRQGNRLVVLGPDRTVHVWDLPRIRQGLSDRQLDWQSDVQSQAPSASEPVYRPPLRFHVDYGDPSQLPEDSAIRTAAEQSQLDLRSE